MKIFNVIFWCYLIYNYFCSMKSRNWCKYLYVSFGMVFIVFEFLWFIWVDEWEECNSFDDVFY